MEVFRIFGSIFMKTDEADKTLERYDKKAKGLTGQLSDLGKKMSNVGKELSLKVTAPLMALGTAAVWNVTQFDDSMSKVQAISGATGEEIIKLRELAKELGSTTAHSASAAADAMGFLALAGWNTNQILSATPAMLSLASAASMDLATAADIVSDTMSAFQISAEKAGETTDIFAAVSSKSNTSVAQLGEAMKYAGAAANAAGMDLAQTSAVLGVLADSGIKGSMAGTTVTAMLRDLRKSAEDGAIAINNTSISVYDAEGNMRDLALVIADVEKATVDMTTEQKAAFLANIFGEQALKGVNIALATGSERLEELTRELYNSEGAAGDMAATMENNVGGALRQLKSATEGLMITLGEHLVPIVEKVANFLIRLTERFQNLSATQQKAIVIIGMIVAAIGPLILIIGKLMSAIAIIIPVIIKLGSVITFLTGPIGLTIAAIALLAFYVYKYWDEIVEFITKSIDVITNIVTNFAEVFKNIWNNIWQGATNIFTSVWEGIKNGFKSAINWILDKLNVFSKVANTVIGVVNVIPGVNIPSVPSIPMLAEGGTISRRGAALIGEEGPELLELPQGARVTPLSSGPAGGVAINIYNPQILNDRDADRLGDLLVGRLRTLGVI